MDFSLVTPLVKGREASCIMALPEEVVLSVVIVKDGFIIVIGVEVVKGI